MWAEVLSGAIEPLGYWRFWAVAVVFGLADLAPLAVSARLIDRYPAWGVAGMMISTVVWSGISVIVAILLLAPILLFGINIVGWKVLTFFTLPRLVTISVLVFAIGLILSIIPLIGQIHAMRRFAQAAVVLAILVAAGPTAHIAVWPGWGLAAVLVATAGVLGSIFLFVGFAIPLVIFGPAVTFPFAKALNGAVTLFPVCLYASWLRLANGL